MRSSGCRASSRNLFEPLKRAFFAGENQATTGTFNAHFEAGVALFSGKSEAENGTRSSRPCSSHLCFMRLW